MLLNPAHACFVDHKRVELLPIQMVRFYPFVELRSVGKTTFSAKSDFGLFSAFVADSHSQSLRLSNRKEPFQGEDAVLLVSIPVESKFISIPSK